MLFQLLLVVHVMSAMVWFGGTLLVPRRARAALDAGLPAARPQLEALGREGRMMAGAALIVFLSGVSLVMVRGGFAGLPVRFHIGLTLSLIWIIVGATAVRSTGEKLVAAAQGEAITDDADALRRRLSMLTGIQHGLFTVITVLMLWRLG